MKDAMEKWFDQQDFDLEQLPEGHEQRFLARLEAACEDEKQAVEQSATPTGRVIDMKPILKWAAAAVIAVLIGSASFLVGKSQSSELKSVSPAMAKTQKEYVEVVDQQLLALNKLQSPATERIIADAKAKLQKLETDYSKVEKDFFTNADNPAVMDAMIQNFKNRILVLEEARQQIYSQQEQLKKQDYDIF